MLFHHEKLNLLNVLRARALCTFRHLIFQKRSGCDNFQRFLPLFTSKCDGSAPTAFVSLLFDPPEPNHWNNLPGCTFPSVQIVGSSTSKVFFGQPKSQQQLI